MASKTTPKQTIEIPGKTVYTCDRCGKSGEIRKPGAFVWGGMHAKSVEFWDTGIDGATGGYRQDIDLCGSCKAVFLRWLEQGEEIKALDTDLGKIEAQVRDAEQPYLAFENKVILGLIERLRAAEAALGKG